MTNKKLETIEELTKKINEKIDDEKLQEASGGTHILYYCTGPECTFDTSSYQRCWLIEKLHYEDFCPIKQYADRGEEWPFGK